MKLNGSRLHWSREKEAGHLRYVARLCDGGKVVASVTRRSPEGDWWACFADDLVPVQGTLRQAKDAVEGALLGDDGRG